MEKLPKLSPKQRRAAKHKFSASHHKSDHRLFIGEKANRTVGIDLKDKDGRNRIIMRVNPNGAPELEFLNAKGKIIMRLPSKTGTGKSSG